MTIVYAVFQQGVYRHDCGGVFTTLEQARTAAVERLRSEPDAYHEWEVIPFVLGKGGDEAEPVAAFRRTEGLRSGLPAQVEEYTK